MVETCEACDVLRRHARRVLLNGGAGQEVGELNGPCGDKEELRGKKQQESELID